VSDENKALMQRFVEAFDRVTWRHRSAQTKHEEYVTPLAVPARK
jgi:hypothetical protein